MSGKIKLDNGTELTYQPETGMYHEAPQFTVVLDWTELGWEPEAVAVQATNAREAIERAIAQVAAGRTDNVGNMVTEGDLYAVMVFSGDVTSLTVEA